MTEAQLYDEMNKIQGAYGLVHITEGVKGAGGQEYINGFHINSTAPYFNKYPGAPYEMKDYALLTAVLSALLWRRFNGPITMITDQDGKEYYCRYGLDAVWDRVVAGLDRRIEGIDPWKFWAAGKILALKELPAPCAIIDMDFLIWDDITALVKNTVVTVAHREPLTEWIYPGREYFSETPGDCFDPDWDWGEEPLNTCFLYIEDEGIKNDYTGKSLYFMKNTGSGRDDGVKSMVFAEQRMLAMCLEAYGVVPSVLMEKERLYVPQSRYSHLWNAKVAFDESEELRKYYCRHCIRIIGETFPAYLRILSQVPCLRDYFRWEKKR